MSFIVMLLRQGVEQRLNVGVDTRQQSNDATEQLVQHPGEDRGQARAPLSTEGGV
jgi:hypothetical protein